MFKNALHAAILLAGLAQVAIAATSLLIPRLLNWREQTARLLPLTRQVFWTYAGYIFATNLAFGLLSIAAPAILMDGSSLAAVVAGFIALYWIARVTVQCVVFDRTIAKQPLFALAEVLYVSAFVYLGVVYSVASAFNAGWIRQ